MGYGPIARKLGWCVCKKSERKRWVVLKDGGHGYYYTKEFKNACVGCRKVERIRDNPAVCGYLRFGGSIRKGKHKPIISRETFEKSQSLHHHKPSLVVILPTDEYDVAYDMRYNARRPFNYRAVPKAESGGRIDPLKRL